MNKKAYLYKISGVHRISPRPTDYVYVLLPEAVEPTAKAIGKLLRRRDVDMLAPGRSVRAILSKDQLSDKMTVFLGGIYHSATIELVAERPIQAPHVLSKVALVGAYEMGTGRYYGSNGPGESLYRLTDASGVVLWLGRAKNRSAAARAAYAAWKVDNTASPTYRQDWPGVERGGSFVNILRTKYDGSTDPTKGDVE